MFNGQLQCENKLKPRKTNEGTDIFSSIMNICLLINAALEM